MSLIRYIIKLLSIFLRIPSLLCKSRNNGDSFIMTYHMVSGILNKELDIKPSVFEAQIDWLKSNYQIVSLEKLIDESPKSSVAITFDDGYSDFFHVVYPILKRNNIPVTLFVCTNLIESQQNMFTFGSSEGIAPLTWDQIRMLDNDPLVTLGAHTHTHDNLINLNSAEIVEDISISNSTFLDEVGYVPRFFAYPRGFYDKRVKELVSDHYDFAFTTRNDFLNNDRYDQFSLPRLSSRRSDTMTFFKLRLKGLLLLEDDIMVLLKKAFVTLFNKK